MSAAVPGYDWRMAMRGNKRCRGSTPEGHLNETFRVGGGHGELLQGNVIPHLKDEESQEMRNLKEM